MTAADLHAAPSSVRGLEPIIETIDLVKTYPGTDFRAVDGLNLQVSMGEVYGLLGPNGAGKTTTVGVLTTRVIPSGGRAFVGGIDVVAHPTLAKQMIALTRVRFKSPAVIRAFHC